MLSIIIEMDPPVIVYGKFTDPVEFGKFEHRNYAYYFNSYYYSIGNYVYYLTNHNDLGDYINTIATVSDNYYNHF